MGAILNTALEKLIRQKEMRISEIESYQLNIETYTLMIQLAKKDPDLYEFARSLEETLKSERLEHKKCKLYLEVVEHQIGQLK